MESTNYVIARDTDLPLDEAVEKTRGLLQEAGYGILSEIDVKAKLEEKLGIEREPYVILGACNPQLAYQALQLEPELGLLLPCNVIVYDNGDETTTVSIVDPIQMLGVVENPALQPVAEEANRRLQRVVAHLAAQPTLQA